jgi:hypothetical protein
MTIAGLREDDVAIDHLRVKASRGDVNLVERELTLASWPRVRSGSWVFIRQVHAKAPRNQLAPTLSAQARRIMDSATGSKDNGLVVSFASFEELLVRLLTDLAYGRASRHWYWQRWSYLFSLPPGRAVAVLMETHADHLPAVTAGLAKTGVLSLVWRKLDREDTVRLTAVVARRSGLRLPQMPSGINGTEPQLAPPAVPSHLQTRWASTLNDLPAGDPRRMLAMILIGQESFPLFLQRAPEGLITAIGKTFGDPAQPPGHDLLQGPQSFFAAGDTATPEGTWDAPGPLDPTQQVAADAGDKPVLKTTLPPDSQPAQAIEETQSRQLDSAETQPPQTLEADNVEPAVLRHTLPGARVPGEGSAAPTEADGISPTPTDHFPEIDPITTPSRLEHRVRLEGTRSQRTFDSFDTRQGGLFFLLNFLKRDDVQAMIRQEQAESDLASGWGWLYRLGHELALDEDDPVVLFLARQMGLEQIEHMETLPPLPAREELLALAQHLYGRTELWRPQLLELQGRVIFSPSHVDLYAALNSVRLPVRLAGLDINPGWLPWLGRVVTFHYE